MTECEIQKDLFDKMLKSGKTHWSIFGFMYKLERVNIVSVKSEEHQEGKQALLVQGRIHYANGVVAQTMCFVMTAKAFSREITGIE